MYADIIIDISHEKLDKTFQYHIPDELINRLIIGMKVSVPFGNSKRTGYVVNITAEPVFDVLKIKDIISIDESAMAIESQLIALAAWIKRNYGGTMSRALKTVIPVSKQQKQLLKKTVSLAVDSDTASDALAGFIKKKATARVRLLEALIDEKSIDYDDILHRLNISGTVVKGLKESGLVKIVETATYRNPIKVADSDTKKIELNTEQKKIVDEITADFLDGDYKNYLIHGVTGSGKTEVYIRLIEEAVKRGRQAIVLIPEIALTFQTVMRFYKSFGDRVSILHSRLSAGERSDQFLRAKRGELDVMIGPRSALFTPFDKLGYIIIDEEHEGAYKSETTPCFHARETAFERARMCGASVVLGSATPSLEAYYGVEKGNIKLYKLTSRAGKASNAKCEVVDLREELRSGNKNIISRRLDELILDRLEKKEQIMLFLNRRGISSFISCRECGQVVKCPHCDVSLSLHKGDKLICHYCGYTMPNVSNCPKCGSKYIGGFKAGTQKVEELVAKAYPNARILRMDYDTTRRKDDYENILSAFANEEADILIGTQMIVKGHDFPKVTLVGILAADISLGISDYRAQERTFELLTQAEGRAGRGDREGIAIVQTYQPDNIAIQYSLAQDFDGFYEKEIEFRRVMCYPPVWNILKISTSSISQEEADGLCEYIGPILRDIAKSLESTIVIGPADAVVNKINDRYLKVVYIKSSEYENLITIKDHVEKLMHEDNRFSNTLFSFEFN